MSYDELVAHFKSGPKAAAKMGLTRQTVHYWKTHGIPHHHQLHAQRVSKGKLRADPREEK